MTTTDITRIESIVKKYRAYVTTHCRKYPTLLLQTSFDGDMEEVMEPDSYDIAADIQLVAVLYDTVIKVDSDDRIKTALSDYFRCYKSEALSGEEFQYLCKHYAEVIEYEFGNRKEWWDSFETNRIAIDDEKEYLGFFEHILAKELQKQAPCSVYLAMAGLGDLAFCFPKNTIIYGCTHDDDSEPDEEWALGQIRLQAAGYRSEITPSFILTENRYDFICGHSASEKNTELFHFLSDKGKMLLVVKDGSFTKQQTIYDIIIQSKCSLKSVVYKNFKATELWGFDIGYLFITIDRHTTHSVLMRNDNKNQECLVGYDELDSKVLWPTYYLTEKPKSGIPLSKIMAIATEGSEERLADETEVIDELESTFHKIVKPVSSNIHVSDYRKAEKDWALSSIKQPCVLFRSIGDAYGLRVVKHIPKQGYATRYVQLVPKDGIDLYYLAATLLRPEVKSQIMGFCKYAAKHYLQHFLDKILVPDDSPEERAKFVSEIAIQSIDVLHNEMQQQQKGYERGVRMRKHALSQSLSAIDAIFNVLYRYFEEKGCLKAKDGISNRLTVAEAFGFIRNKMPDVMNLTEHLADVEYDFGDSEWINPYGFISKIIDKSSPIKYKLINSGVNDEGCAFIYFPPKALVRILENIINNAESHGFTDNNRTDYCIDFSWEIRDDLISIIIKNNGNPLADGINNSNVFEYGKSSCLNINRHNGIGCHEIKFIMEKYDAMVSVRSMQKTPNNNFTVAYILTFKRTNINKRTNIKEENNYGTVN